MLGHHRHASEMPFKMAFRWRADDGQLYPPSPHKLKKKHCQVGPPLTKLSAYAHAFIIPKNHARTHIDLGLFACGALAASICVGIVIPSTWFVYLYNILLA